jgi:hypothetical protein
MFSFPSVVVGCVIVRAAGARGQVRTSFLLYPFSSRTCISQGVVLTPLVLYHYVFILSTSSPEPRCQATQFISFQITLGAYLQWISAALVLVNTHYTKSITHASRVTHHALGVVTHQATLHQCHVRASYLSRTSPRTPAHPTN